MSLRAGLDADELISQLKGIRCLSTLKRGGQGNGVKVLSCPDAIGRAIEHYKNAKALKEEKPISEVDSKGQLTFESVPQREKDGRGCPDCGQPLEHEGGCVICRACGFSKCG